MNAISRIASGSVSIGLGAVVLYVARTSSGVDWVIACAWGLFLLGIGVYLLLHTKEDAIEEVHDNT